jgi:hypothetical protein
MVAPTNIKLKIFLHKYYKVLSRLCACFQVPTVSQDESKDRKMTEFRLFAEKAALSAPC